MYVAVVLWRSVREAKKSGRMVSRGMMRCGLGCAAA